MARRFYLADSLRTQRSWLTTRGALILFSVVLIGTVWFAIDLGYDTGAVESDAAALNLGSEIETTSNADNAIRDHEEVPVVMERDSELSIAQSAVDFADNRPIRIQILNGCGVKGLGKRLSPGLRKQGFDVREVRNAQSFEHESSTVIDRTGNIRLAQEVAAALGIDSTRVSSESREDLVDIDVTLLVGMDYTRLQFGETGGN